MQTEGVYKSDYEIRAYMGNMSIFADQINEYAEHGRLVSDSVKKIIDVTVDTVYVLDRMIRAGDKQAVRLLYKNNKPALEKGIKAWELLAKKFPKDADGERTFYAKDVIWIIEEARKIAEENPQ